MLWSLIFSKRKHFWKPEGLQLVKAIARIEKNCSRFCPEAKNEKPQLHQDFKNTFLNEFSF